MEMIQVKSSAISAIGHDPSTLRMKIHFVAGHTYDFCRVPKNVFAEFLSASSVGAYYNVHIKDRYQC